MTKTFAVEEEPLATPTYLKIQDWAAADGPREKLLHRGSGALTDAELLAILIGSGIKNRSAVDLAQLILQ